MDSLYRDVLSKKRQQSSLQDSQRETTGASHLSTHRIVSDQLKDSQKDNNQSKEYSDHQSELRGENRSSSVQSESSSETSEQQLARDRPGQPPLAAPAQINISQPIGSLCGAVTVGSGGSLTVRGEIETISDEEILKNRESAEGIRSIPRFRNYQPGKPAKVSTATSHKVMILIVSSSDICFKPCLKYISVFEADMALQQFDLAKTSEYLLKLVFLVRN